MFSNMTHDLAYTLLGLAFCLTLGAFSWRQHTKEHNSVKPRMMPWVMITMACVATIFMLGVHLFNIFGFETGRR